MKKINDLKIGTRLNLVFNAAFIVIICLLGVYTIVSQRKQIFTDTDTRMYEQVNDLANTIEEQIAQSQNNVNTAYEVGHYIDQMTGSITTSNKLINVHAVNQVTGESSDIQIKQLLINGTPLYNYTKTIDQIYRLTGVHAMILQKIPQGYLRISSSITKNDGTRQINSFVPNGTPMAQALDNGEKYTGRSILLNDWYLVSCQPATLNDGTKLAFATGTPEKRMEALRTLFKSKKYFDTGYPYLVTKSGDLTIHPTSEGTNVGSDKIQKKMIADQDGIGSFNYTWEGKAKIQYFKYIPIIDSYVVVSLYQSEFTKVVKRVTVAIIVAVLLGVGIFIMITLLLSRTITSNLSKGVQFAKYIAQGDLSVDLKVTQQDEVGELAGALSQMLAKLKEIVMSIRNAAETISSASVQISNGSQQLSEGATEQASSTEEISSSMEEMVSNIQQNTDNAKQTESISSKANDSVAEMSKISRESLDSIKTIAEKITIINDIAFQTNLLALNAAVEAARAGEHGRGFAVVAAEVRKLAERSKLAADEIETLSKNSLKMTERAQESLVALLPGVQKTSQLVQEIAAASIEQNSGADQINSALQQLNIVSQQNAAASEEMATSAEELSSQAENLKETVSYFRIDFENQNYVSSGKNKAAKTANSVEKKEDHTLSQNVKNTLHHNHLSAGIKQSSKEGDFESF